MGIITSKLNLLEEIAVGAGIVNVMILTDNLLSQGNPEIIYNPAVLILSGITVAGGISAIYRVVGRAKEEKYGSKK